MVRLGSSCGVVPLGREVRDAAALILRRVLTARVNRGERPAVPVAILIDPMRVDQESREGAPPGGRCVVGATRHINDRAV